MLGTLVLCDNLCTLPYLLLHSLVRIALEIEQRDSPVVDDGFDNIVVFLPAEIAGVDSGAKKCV